MSYAEGTCHRVPRWLIPFLVVAVGSSCREPTAASPELPLVPNVGRIAFAGIRGQQRDIFVMHPDGSGLVNLTNDANDEDADPVWSPDGRRIAFTHYSGGDYDIYVMNADGSGRVDVTNGPLWEMNPSWSPDGTRLAFNTLVMNSSADVETINVDGSGRKVVAPGVDPSWSPDGASLAFVAAGPGGTGGIAIANVDGSNQRFVSGTTPADLDPAWSPDGTELAIVGYSRLAIIRADGTNRRTLDDVPESLHRSPTWSPDGRFIVYTRSMPAAGDQVYVVGRELGPFRALTIGSGGVPVVNENFQPTWSVDAR